MRTRRRRKQARLNFIRFFRRKLRRRNKRAKKCTSSADGAWSTNTRESEMPNDPAFRSLRRLTFVFNIINIVHGAWASDVRCAVALIYCVVHIFHMIERNVCCKNAECKQIYENIVRSECVCTGPHREEDESVQIIIVIMGKTTFIKP